MGPREVAQFVNSGLCKQEALGSILSIHIKSQAHLHTPLIQHWEAETGESWGLAGQQLQQNW